MYWNSSQRIKNQRQICKSSINPSGSVPPLWPASWPMPMHRAAAMLHFKHARALVSCEHWACQVSALSWSCADKDGRVLRGVCRQGLLDLFGKMCNFLQSESILNSPSPSPWESEGAWNFELPAWFEGQTGMKPTKGWSTALMDSIL